jgi:UDP-glucose 4-epimerase
MRLFLTGGTGFIGAHVLCAALAAGHDVRALRRTPLTSPPIPLPCQPMWCEGDLHTLDSAWLDDVDAVLHMASAGVSPKQASWNQLVHVNVIGSLLLMEIAAEAGVHRYVVAGSSHEYGNTALRYDRIPPDAPLEPLSPDGASKASAFQLLRTYAIDRRLELFYGRIFSAYGKVQSAENFWPSLSRAALAGDDFCMTSGEQISDFIPAKAVAQHLVKACMRSDLKSGVPLVVNIGSGTASSFLAFAQSEWERLGARRGRLLPGILPNRPNQIARYVPDLVGLQIMTPAFE